MEAIARNAQFKRVRVEPTSDELRKVLKHPNGMAFRSTGSVEWPLDKFTQRRIAEGSVKIAEKKDEQKDGEQKDGERTAHRTRSQAPAS